MAEWYKKNLLGACRPAPNGIPSSTGAWLPTRRRVCLRASYPGVRALRSGREAPDKEGSAQRNIIPL
jgi:hypothetical protein